MVCIQELFDNREDVFRIDADVALSHCDFFELGLAKAMPMDG